LGGTPDPDLGMVAGLGGFAPLTGGFAGAGGGAVVLLAGRFPNITLIRKQKP